MVPPTVGKYNQYNSYTLPIGQLDLESLPLKLCSQVILSPVKLTIKLSLHCKEAEGVLGTVPKLPGVPKSTTSSSPYH